MSVGSSPLQAKTWSAKDVDRTPPRSKARNALVRRRHEAGVTDQLRQGLPADLAICGARDLAHEHDLARTFVRGQISGAVGEDGGFVERSFRRGTTKAAITETSSATFRSATATSAMSGLAARTFSTSSGDTR